MRTIVAATLGALALGIAGCGGDDPPRAALPDANPKPSCPSKWRAGWEQLANETHGVVYCPTFMPSPLDGKIGGQFANGRSVDPDRSWLVSLLWFERGVGGITGEVHVNFRGYPGRTSIPVCEDTLTVNGVTKRTKIPCFSDPRGTRRAGEIKARVYTVNQGADQWHVLYAWKRQGTLYTVSQHVIEPYGYSAVVRNLDKVLRGLVLIEPRSAA